MKKIFLCIPFIFMSIGVKAQKAEEVVSIFQGILQRAKLNFKDDLGDKLREDTVKKMALYLTKNATLGTISVIIHHFADNQNLYIMKFDAEPDDLTTAGIKTLILAEQSKMAYSGEYICRRYKDTKNSDVTEFKDKKGNHVMDVLFNDKYDQYTIYGMQP